jgi:hypothetical protein
VFSTENYRYGVTTLKCGNGFNLEYINDVPVCAISNSVIVDVSG